MAFGRSKSIYKSPADLRSMIEPGLVTAASLEAVRTAIRAGISTLELDAIAEATIRSLGGVPNFMKEPGYRHTVCVSVNEAVVHGIPNDYVLQPGDVVSVDSGAEVKGWNGDAAFTVVVPDPARPELVSERQALASTTERALWAGIAGLATVRDLNTLGAIIEDTIEAAGRDYGIIEDYTGHGIGRSMHEEPPVFNYRVRGAGPQVKPGLVIAIEPMVVTGGVDTRTLADEWTVVTEDGGMAAHWEHSVAVHSGGLWVLTAPDGGAAGLLPFGVTPVPIA
jgi:methionyl aminopeptidase